VASVVTKGIHRVVTKCINCPNC